MKARPHGHLKDCLVGIRNKVNLIDDAHLSGDQKQTLSTACDAADYETIRDLLRVADKNSDIYKTENQRTSNIQILIMQSLLSNFENHCINIAYRNVLEAVSLLVNDPIPYPSIELLRISGKLETRDAKAATEMLVPFFEDFVKNPAACMTDLENKSAIERYLRTALIYLNFLRPDGS